MTEYPIYGAPREIENSIESEWEAGWADGFEAGVKYEKDRKIREENVSNWKQNTGSE